MQTVTDTTDFSRAALLRRAIDEAGSLADGLGLARDVAAFLSGDPLVEMKALPAPETPPPEEPAEAPVAREAPAAVAAINIDFDDLPETAQRTAQTIKRLQAAGGKVTLETLAEEMGFKTGSNASYHVARLKKDGFLSVKGCRGSNNHAWTLLKPVPDGPAMENPPATPKAAPAKPPVKLLFPAPVEFSACAPKPAPLSSGRWGLHNADSRAPAPPSEPDDDNDLHIVSFEPGDACYIPAVRAVKTLTDSGFEITDLGGQTFEVFSGGLGKPETFMFRALLRMANATLQRKGLELIEEPKMEGVR